MKVSLTIDTANAAFDGDVTSEVTDILRVLTYKITLGDVELEPGASYPLRDSNGNRVGFFKVES